jgi:SAM-dependent methyltransferase
MNMTHYGDEFFENQVDGSLNSARVIVPLVLDLLSVSSVVDFGCGRGTWLSVFKEAGTSEILGLDGNYVERQRLLIDPSCFQAVDLTVPIALGRSFDLAICVEVAEHLPTMKSETLVQSLTEASPFVLFSAAVPGQGGVHHVNEQWPDYWEALFALRHYERLDPFRPVLLRDGRVRWWYRQNLYLYARSDRIKGCPRLEVEQRLAEEAEIDLVSHAVFSRYKYFRGLTGALVDATGRAIRRRLSWWE